MSVVEEIRTAIDKLTELRDQSTPGPWAREGVDVYYVPGGATILTPEDAYPRGDNAPVENAQLVVLLHRTIDAQLAILQHAIDEYEPRDDTMSFITEDGLALARAINGVTS